MRQSVSDQSIRKQRRIQGISAVWILLLGCSVLLACTYVFLNLARFTVQMDSDIAAEALNARAIWEHRSIIPASFYPSTERRILNVNLIGALLYGLTGNMNLSMGIACCVMGGILLALYGRLLKRLDFSGVPLWAAITLLLAIPGSMRHSQLLYLYAVYYAIHCICMLVTIWILLDVRRGARDWTGKAAAAAVLAFLISLSGLRAALICYAPLFATELLRLAIGNDFCSRRKRRTRKDSACPVGYARENAAKECKTSERQRFGHLRGVLYAGGLLAASFAGSKMPTAVGVSTSRNLRGGVSKLLHTVLPDLMGSVYCENQSGLRAILLVVFVTTAVAGGIGVVRAADAFGKTFTDGSGASGIAAEEEHASRQDRAFVLGFFWMSLLLSVVMGAFTTTESVWRYYFMSYYVLSFGTACLLQGVIEWDRKGVKKEGYRRKWGRLTEVVLAVCIAVFAILVWKEELLPSACRSSGNAEYEQIVQWMQEQDCRYGYSTYDSANAITGSCNGAVQVSAVADLETLEICKWLTDSEWYVPSLPADMKTAYIVPKSLEESFSLNPERHADIIEGLETENYIVYMAEHNYTQGECGV